MNQSVCSRLGQAALLLLAACGSDAAEPEQAADSVAVEDGGAAAPDGQKAATKSAFFTAPFLVIAHRGGRNLRPEHTLEAYKHALSLGPPASPDPVVLELDLRPNSEGAVVVMHDSEVDRTTDGVGDVAAMTLSQIKALDAGYRFSSDGGKTFPWRGKGLTVPTLDEVLDAWPDALYVIEIKRDDPPIIDKVLAALQARGAIPRTVLSAFNDLDLEEIRLKRPDALTGMGVIEMVKFAALQPDQLADYVPPAGFAQPPMSALTEKLVIRAHDFGVKLHPWTINKAADMKQLIGWQVDGIMTDDPALLIEVRADMALGGGAAPDLPGLLAHLSVAVTPLDMAAGRSGDLVFVAGGMSPVGAFGEPDPEGAGVRPNMAFRVAPGTAVRSPVVGEVVQLLEQKESKDWEVHLRPTKGPPGWVVMLDHVSDPKVAVGDSVAVTTVVGYATPWAPSWSLVELHLALDIATSGNSVYDHYCPTALLAPDAKEAVIADLIGAVKAATQAPWRLPASGEAAAESGCVCTRIVEDAAASARAGSRQVSCSAAE